MNNVLPSSVHLHEKYDLKGSTYKRQASRQERRKAKPTLKDLDFLQLHPTGLAVPADAYQALVRTIEKDCRVSCVLCSAVCLLHLSVSLTLSDLRCLFVSHTCVHYRERC